MNLELTGKIVGVLESKDGTTKEGKRWERKEYILETDEQHPKKMRFMVFNTEEKTLPSLENGDTAKISFEIDCREYQGKWYNEIKAWKIEKAQ